MQSTHTQELCSVTGKPKLLAHRAYAQAAYAQAGRRVALAHRCRYCGAYHVSSVARLERTARLPSKERRWRYAGDEDES